MHFSDESKFNLFESDGRRGVGETSSPKCIKRSVKFGGGSIIVCGMISDEGIGPMLRLYRRVNVAAYEELVKQHVLLILRN